MTRPVSPPSMEKDVSRQGWEIQRQAFMPMAFRWRTPDVDEPLPDGVTPELENGWAQPDPPLERFSYRLHSDGSLEFKGHLDGTATSSGTVAFTLPEAPTDPDEFPEPNYRLPHDQFFLSVIYDGATPQAALIYLTALTGEVTITWPVT